MVLSANTNWEFRATATASMVNGGGFNLTNSNMLTDLATDTNTANTSSPIVSSASYIFLSSDVGNYVYVQAGTNWQPGWYLIASVTAGKATLVATIGSVVINITRQGIATYNIAVGCTNNNSATLTAGTFTIDYSQMSTAVINGIADFAAVGASSTLTSATAGFTPVMVGNIFHQTTTGTGGFGLAGWYEIVSYVNATTVTLDRTPNNGTASVACTGYVGGALDLSGTLADSFYEMIIGGNILWYKSGTYTITSPISIASTLSTLAAPSYNMGYANIRGDNPSPFGASATAPLINGGAQTTAFGQGQCFAYMSFISTAANGFSAAIYGTFHDCKFVNSSITTSRTAFTGGGGACYNIEAVSQSGNAINGTPAEFKLNNAYVHDSANGFSIGTRQSVINSIVQACRTSGIVVGTNSALIQNNTIFGYVNTPRGTGILFNVNLGNVTIINNIISNWSTGIGQTTTQMYSNSGFNNAFYGNTTDVSNYSMDKSDVVGVNPSFAGVAELTGSTATISTNTLTQAGAFATVTDNVDYIQVHSGTGATVSSYLITSHTANTVTVNNSIGTSAVADKVWTITTNRNFAIGTALKGLGSPGPIPGTNSTGYMDIGGLQRQEAGGGSALSYSSMT